jgi:hypothetical protein
MRKRIFHSIFAILHRGKALFSLIRSFDPGSSTSSLAPAKKKLGDFG